MRASPEAIFRNIWLRSTQQQNAWKHQNRIPAKTCCFEQSFSYHSFRSDSTHTFSISITKLDKLFYKDDYCSFPAVPVGGILEMSEDVQYLYRCLKGRYLVGQQRAICDPATGEWTLPSCIEISSNFLKRQQNLKIDCRNYSFFKLLNQHLSF